MKIRKALRRGILGAPIGIFIGYTITILIALFNMEAGKYYPVVPQLTEQVNSEITAVVVQYVLMAVMGFGYAFGASVFEIEQWGIAKQTIINFLIITISTFPIAYTCYWMKHSLIGILSYVGIFVVIYIIIWASKMYFWSRRIRSINDTLKNSKQ